MTIHERFKKIRKNLGLSQSELAEILEVKQGVLSDIERGRIEPSKNIVVKLIENFDIDANWLLTGKSRFERVEQKEANHIQTEVWSKEDLEINRTLTELQKTINFAKQVSQEEGLVSKDENQAVQLVKENALLKAKVRILRAQLKLLIRLILAIKSHQD